MKKATWWFRAMLVVLVTLLGCLAMAAQNAAAQMGARDPGRVTERGVEWYEAQHLADGPAAKPLVFKSASHYVLVPVIVTDDKGRPVEGLAKEAFTVLENAKPQAIASFQEITAAAVPMRRVKVQPAPTGMAYELSNRYESSNPALSASPRRLTVIALDLINTPPQNQLQACNAMLKLLPEGIDGNSLIRLVVVRGSGVSIIHDFTDDPRALMGVVRKLSVAVHENRSEEISRKDLLLLFNSIDLSDREEVRMYDAYKRAIEELDVEQQRHSIADVMKGFEFVAQSLAGLPGRKSLIWLTYGFGMAGQPSDTSQRFERAMAALNVANVAVYPVDAKGLIGIGLSSGDLAEPITQRVGTKYLGTLDQQLMTKSVREGRPLSAAWAPKDVDYTDLADSMRAVAEATGGKAFFNNNDLAAQMREASQDGAHYYMISYKLNTKDTRSGWRKLDVKVEQKGLKVRARRGFYLTQEALEPELSRDHDLKLALDSPLDFTGMPMLVRWTMPTGGKKEKQKVTFEMEVAPDALQLASDARNVDFDFAFLASDAKGKEAASKFQRYKAKVSDTGLAQLKESGLTYKNEFELASGEYGVRFVVRDNSTGRLGSVWATVKIP